jgi:hypothetical protein
MVVKHGLAMGPNYQIRWSLGLYGSACNVLFTVPGMNDSTV